jgi:ATP-dependent protease ClpP protease subunit
MLWKPKYSKTIEKKLWALRIALFQQGKSEQEMALACRQLVEDEQEKSKQRKRKKLDKIFQQSMKQANTFLFEEIDSEGFKIKIMGYKKEFVFVEEKRNLLSGQVYYSWVFNSPETNQDVKMENLTFEGAENTYFSSLLEDSYILVLDKLNKNGKRCGKVYVDMLTQKILRYKELF